MFTIEDELHAELQAGDYASVEEARAELERRSVLPWDQPPNRAPCKGWKTCGREYLIIEYDDSADPWKVLSRVPVLQIDADGARWLNTK